MSSVLNQLGLLLAGRRPGYPGTRTPAWNPAQPMPYPNVGEDSNDPQQPRDPQPEQRSQFEGQDRSFMRKLYDGLVSNPMGPAFTLAMANTLTAPLRPGQTETGKWIEGVTQGYNTMGALTKLRAQQQAQQREEARKDAKVAQDWQQTNTQTQRVMDQGKEGEAKAENDAATLRETERRNKEDEKLRRDKMDADRKTAEERAKVATERFRRMLILETQRFAQEAKQTQLKEKELGQQATYQGRMAGAAETNASANLKRAAADALRAQVALKAAEKGFTPEQTARILQIAGDRAELISNVELLDGDPKAAEALINNKTNEVLSEFERISGRTQGQGQGQGQGPASTPGRLRYDPATSSLKPVPQTGAK